MSEVHQLPCTIIVPTRNRVDKLKKCIASLLALEYPAFEIIIVNDASSDDTKQFLDSLRNIKIQAIHLSSRAGQAEARNAGIRAAQSDIIAFTDDDCTVRPQWLHELMSAFEDQAIDFAFGRTYYVSESYHGKFPEKVVTNSKGSWPAAGNIAYRKKIFSAIGGFNKKFERFHNEDTELALRAVAHGFHFAKEPHAIVFHLPAQWRIQALLASAKNHAAFPLLKKKYPNQYRTFGGPVYFGIIIAPTEYVYLVLSPLLVPLLLIRYLMRGNKNLALFFCRWPLWLVLKRLWIYRMAISCRVLML